ncbi:MAG: helix-turn-helix domain-containing protein [Heliobacteriaceae bacterium]|jgi:transcriptional regulator with XRE-family HTH domain|nr:helix-turn-helix domain-containing protein [Heliobacteriaceae bacterium]
MSNKDFYNKLGSKIRFLRKKKKLTIARLAENANIDDYFLGEIERAEKKPSLDTLLKLSAALEVEIYKLFR